MGTTAPASAVGRRDRRRDAILDAVLVLLDRHGYEGTSMAKVATEAGASKETLYAWFGDKAGLFGALIEREADKVADRVRASVARAPEGDQPRLVLEAFGDAIVAMLLGPGSVAINRAAIADGTGALATVLAERGRGSVGPLVSDWLAAEHDAGRLRVPDPPLAFERLMGLLLGDAQVRRLLGVVRAPTEGERARRVALAVDAFLVLHGHS